MIVFTDELSANVSVEQDLEINPSYLTGDVLVSYLSEIHSTGSRCNINILILLFFMHKSFLANGTIAIKIIMRRNLWYYLTWCCKLYLLLRRDRKTWLAKTNRTHWIAKKPTAINKQKYLHFRHCDLPK